MTTYTHNARTLGEIAVLQAKINRLKDLLPLLPFKKVNFFFYGTNGVFVGLDQSMLPFDMGIEIGILIEASIEHYENQLKELKNF